MKDLYILVMSVGEYSTNWTCHYIEKIGGKDRLIVCLPKQFEANAKSYKDNGVEVYVYDESKYINKDFEYYGFKPRNCGGIGRQGIAEATEKFASDDKVLLELDDDTQALCVKKRKDDGRMVATQIRKFSDLEKLVNAENDFYEATKCECVATTGATPPSETFMTSRKMFNNFIMKKGERMNYDGFKALCSDDVRFNFYRNLIDVVPTISHTFANITFHQNQGDRQDGNAPIYNSDYSWKKSFSLRMIAPWACEQRLVQETNRRLFRENFKYAQLYPPILLEDEKGNLFRAR